MKTFKVKDQTLTSAAHLIKEGNAMLAQGKKLAEAGKATIEAWLKDNRGVELASEPIGEIINIDGIVIVEIGKQTRFNEKRFAVEKPELHAEYREEMAIKKFKPLL